MNGNSEEIEAELTIQVEAYKANDFVEAELVEETEYFMNSNSDAIEFELTFQVETYNANDFVEAELTTETESWITIQNSLKSTEMVAYIQRGIDIEKFDQK